MDSQSSFIPKTNSTPKRNKKRNNIFFVTLATYCIFFGTLIGSGILFVYERVTVNQIRQAVTKLDTNLKSFNQNDYIKVQQFDARLTEATKLFSSTVPLRQVLETIASTTPQTVALTNLSLERVGTNYQVTASVEADSFDAVLFYRDTLRQSLKFATSSITDLSYNPAVQSDAEAEAKLQYKVQFEIITPQIDITAS